MLTTLKRETFRTSQLLDFVSEKELVAQVGHPREEWPLVVLKESIDNALDACEEIGVAPLISVTADKSAVTVADNGPGITTETIESVCDFSVRVSSREAYVSPTRGAQGNALKTLITMPFVLDGEHGWTEISSRSTRHRLSVSVDRIRQQPLVRHEQSSGNVSGGTEIRICSPELASSLLDASRSRFLQFADAYAWLNPHLDLTVELVGERLLDVRPTDPVFRKWRPSDPTSPHWYRPDHLERLIAAYVAHDAEVGRERTVREFVAEFRGLSATTKQKQVLAATGLARAKLSDLRSQNGLHSEMVRGLLAAMQAHSKAVKPIALGPVGQEHLRARFENLGYERESFRYHRQMGTTAEGLPAIVEAAFAYLPAGGSRRIVTGVNWSPALRNPFRALGAGWRSLDDLLREQFVSDDEPVLLFVHLIQPRVPYTDRGKSAVAL